jgi:hypothetical protein
MKEASSHPALIWPPFSRSMMVGVNPMLPEASRRQGSRRVFSLVWKRLVGFDGGDKRAEEADIEKMKA